MLFKTSAFLLGLQATVSLASPSWPSLQEWKKHQPSHPSNHFPHRPNVHCHPHSPRKPHHPSPPRHKTCYVKSHDDGRDDSKYILEAIEKCNHGGNVVFKEDTQYTIGTALDLTFLQNIDLIIQGYIQFTNDTDYWQANSFPQIFQNVTTFFQLGGSDVNVYGGGTIDGNGQVWYDLYAKDIYILRPVLFGTIGLHGGSISNLNLRYSPQYYNFIANSSDVIFSDITIAGASTSSNVAKNTDGWDTYRSDSITIQNSVINNGDDCVSFKPNSTNILVQNLNCNGSHGISVGSLGQYVGETDIVENVYVYNITMSNASDGARIKVWPGSASALSGDLQGGGGTGSVKNVTYNTFSVANTDYAIELTQCYGQKNLTACNEFPSSLTISDVLFENFSGTTSKKYNPNVGYLVCSSPDVCSDIKATNIDVKSPTGTDGFTCQNLDESALSVNCTTLNLGSN